MDITVMSFYKAAIKKIWIIIVCMIAGLSTGFVLSRRTTASYTSRATLISLDIQKTVIFGDIATMEDLAISKRVITDFTDIVSSYRVAALASELLSEDGYDISPEMLRAMVSASKLQDSAILYLSMSSSNPDIVLPAANAMSDAYVTVIKDIMGSHYVSVLDEAKDVIASYGVSTSTYLIIGLTSGMLFGVAIIYFMIILDKKIRTIDDIARIPNIKIFLIPNNSIK